MRRDHKEVCPLSRGVIFQPLSVPLQNGICFFLVPVPAPLQADFSVCRPRRERYRVSTFRLQKYIGLGGCYRPRGLCVTKAYGQNALHTSITVLVQAYQPLPLVPDHDLYRNFKYFRHTNYLALIRLCGCQKGTPLTISTPRLTALRYIVRVALYSDP